MAENIVEIIIKAIDQASGTLSKIGSAGGDLERKITANWKAIGVAAAAAGVGLELMARKQGELSEATQKLSISSGVQSKELNKIAREVAGAGDSIKETVGIMQKGAEQGLKSGEALKTYAEFWDLVGDASGESSEALADAAVALEAFGISAENVSEAGGAFGYILNETTMSLDEFLSACQKVAPEVEDLGLSVDDMAVIMDSLEERGITGKQAITAIKDAASIAQGDIGKFTKELGLSADALSKAEQKTAPYTKSLNDMAKAHDNNLTPIQKLTSALSEMQYQYGGFIQGMATLAPILISLGPLIAGVSSATTILSGVMTTGAIAVGGMTISLVALLPLLALVGVVLATIYLGQKLNEYQTNQQTEALARMTEAERTEWKQSELNSETWGEQAATLEQVVESSLEVERAADDVSAALDESTQTLDGAAEAALNAGNTYDEFGNLVVTANDKIVDSSGKMGSAVQGACQTCMTATDLAMVGIQNVIQAANNVNSLNIPRTSTASLTSPPSSSGTNYPTPNAAGEYTYPDGTTVKYNPSTGLYEQTGIKQLNPGEEWNYDPSQMGNLERETITSMYSAVYKDAKGNYWAQPTGGGSLTQVNGTIAYRIVAAGGANNLQGMAEGGVAASGGMFIVGENGPELANIPTGGQVSPLTSTLAQDIASAITQALGKGSGGGGGDIHIHTSAIIGDKAGVRRLYRAIDEARNMENTRKDRGVSG